MCLYGNDLDETTSPVEAGLSWVIGKERRSEGAGFVGESEILRQLKEGVERRRVGVVSEGAPARRTFLHSDFLLPLLLTDERVIFHRGREARRPEN